MTGRAHLERGANDIGTSAGGHDLIARGDECWAHDRRVFATAAAAVALLEITDEGAVFKSKGESRRERQLERPREILAQTIVDRVPVPVRLAPVVEDFAGIKNVFRIERVFNFAHDAEQLIAQLLAHVFGARDTDSVLGGKRAFELSDECR